MRKFEVKEELLGDIAKYLATRPWGEVADLMNKIHSPENVKEIKEVQANEEPPKA